MTDKLKKYSIMVPVLVWVGKTIEAEDEYDARCISEDFDFSLEVSPEKGGSAYSQHGCEIQSCCEPDYDRLEVYENDEKK